ncbi:phasin family protein [Pseudomonas syringae pv. actinidiae]|jgi:poly(hydroxyalkanoate) granule-associated protein|uniref:Polyhydroxyalkanoate granule-associated protein PhaI n=12 Tax=Pseudomonas syringae group TaxID=136849 RepID=A0A0P9QHI3_9PSED|nr:MULTISPECIES: phasin family protein [Pseudomonas syringae group]EPN19799.1 polyhydroxyalkanoate granule-associated protein PhaI [Pseudomonas syringae pv. actinidiae ICMP 19070]EPN59042.1 polyhydroxyalkanoate granule-associated protein PhaI [Pseudomonas syringae pv. actinidiae ICMP 19079]EPN84929.1 polyhydroxyalkanoate granule-associated protein PhaI [Pseudomonas syringae pv. actinidiae ICMP 19101]AKT32995.1 poly(3-hydroxyalkanoate) granule-associated protein PhaI [Pseudomonas syringae pv. ac
MARANTKKKIEDEQASTLSDVRLYARKIWLAGLGAYSRVNEEGTQYVKALIRTGEQTEKEVLKTVDETRVAANSEIESIKGEVSGVKGRVDAQLGRIEGAFDRRVAKALNRIGIPSKHDVDTLSAKLDELTALLERVVPKKLERSGSKRLERSGSGQ